MSTPFIGCNACLNQVLGVPGYGATNICAAPQLKAEGLLEVEPLHPDTTGNTTYCEGVRAFKIACGEAARWFVPRIEI